MRALVLGLAVWLAPLAANAQLVRVQQPTDIAFAAENESGMLVVSENAGVAHVPGRYRFVRIDREAGPASEPVEIETGAARGPALFGQRPAALPASGLFHYAIVPPGEYALIYWDSSANRVVDVVNRWACLNDAAPIYAVGAGSVAIVRAPERVETDMFRDIRAARRNFMRHYPEGTTLEYLYSDEKVALDFAEIAATNTRLTAPFRIAAPIGTLAFEVREYASRNQCLPGDGFTVTLAE